MNEKQTTDAVTFPPPGWVDRAGACRILGISPEKLKRWYSERNVRCGKSVAKPGGGQCKIYPIAELERLRDQVRAEPAKAMQGLVDRAEAMRMFNASKTTWNRWQAAGRVPPGHLIRLPGERSERKVYTRVELQRLREKLDKLGLLRPDQETRAAIKAQREADRQAHRAAQHPPEGWVDRFEAERMFGVTTGVWIDWQRKGWVRGKKFGPKLYYERAVLENLLAENGRMGPPYPDPKHPGCYRVPLRTSTMRVLEAIIDAGDLPLVEGRQWNWSEGSGYGGWVALSHLTEPIALRRLITGVSDRGMRVSHANRDPLDCRRENLVVRTMKDLARSNRKMGSVSGREYTSKFKGVCWEKWTGKWLVQINADGIHRNLGRYRDEIAAAQAYDEAAGELYGEHARLNFPDGVDAWLEAEAAAEGRGAERAEAA